MLRRAAILLCLGLLSIACTQTGATTSPRATSAGPSTPAASGGASPGGDSVEIVGVEYAYEGVPATTAAGTTLNFRNGGAEAHEMVVVRKNDDVPQSFEELLALPDDEAFQFITAVGNAVAGPGESADAPVVVAEPGDYLMVCFIPVGTTDLSSVDPSNPPTGEPHMARGMLAQFTVTE